jgi:hypothetical protein
VRATQIERAQINRSCPLSFLEQERGDQKTGEREEQVDAEETAREPEDVLAEDERDREPADAVESRHSAQWLDRGLHVPRRLKTITPSLEKTCVHCGLRSSFLSSLVMSRG